MADTSSNRAPAATPIAEDDPFAELTRIMGFDPRVKVYQPQQPAEPDFGLDLERELLGEFSSHQDNFPVAPAQREAAAPVRQEPTFAEQQAVAPSQQAAVDPQAHASAAEIAAYQTDDETVDFRQAADTFVAEAAQPVAESDVDPFADFELSFDEDETISTNDVLHPAAEPQAAEAVSVQPSAPAAAEDDDEIEAAYAALEAWQHNREKQSAQPVSDTVPQSASAEVLEDQAEPVDGLSPVAPEDDRSDSVETVDPLDQMLVEELLEARNETAAEPVVSAEADAITAVQAEPEGWTETDAADAEADMLGDLDLGDWSKNEPEAHAERDVFTAEDGWLDEGTVSLAEPQVLTQHQAEAASDRDVVQAAPERAEQWPLVETEADQSQPATTAHDEDFERELFDLLGGEMQSEQTSQTGAPVEDDSWLDGIDFAEAEPQDARATAEAASAPATNEDDALWHLDHAEVETARAAAVASQVSVQTVPEPQAAAYEPDAEAEPDLGDFDLTDLLADDADARDVEAPLEANAVQAAEPAPQASPRAVPAEPVSYAQFEASTTAATDPAYDPVPLDMEPDAMQPFDERAFDAALADELAADPYGRDDDQAGGYRQYASSSHGYASQPRAVVNAPSMRAEVPDIETVDFVDQRLAHSDELDLPDVDYGREPAPRANGFDDFDQEFSSSYRALNEEPAPQARRDDPEAHRQASAQNWDEHLDFSMGAAAAGGAAAGAAAGQYGSSLSRAGMYEPEEEDGYYDQPARSQARRGILGRRGTLVASAAAAIILIGGVAMLAMPSGTVGSGEPALVRADSDPMKVRPENPGGTTVPNQDNVVYDRVGSSQPLGAPTQERLISADEAPVDLNAQEPDEESLAGLSALDPDGTDPEGSDIEDVDGEAVGSAKTEDRLTPDTAASGQPVPEEMVAVAPRRVRTMMVRPDGTLAPREEEAAAPAPKLASAAAAVTAEPAAVKPSASPNLPKTIESAIAETPVAQPKPAPAPAPQVAAVQPATQPSAAPQAVPAAAAPSGWAVQIASQPTEAAAQSSYDSLARRYASVLNGRGVNIVRADIAGKGTYYRVRIPASSRAEANTICTNYKGAGGTCFVSQ